MKKFIYIIISLFIAVSLVSADKISQPPVLKNETVAEQQYFREIYNNWNNLEAITTNPDGTRSGEYGDMVLLLSGGNYYVEICVSSPSGTVWRGILLSDTP